MIGVFSQKIVSCFIKQQVIDKGDEELYVYGVFVLLSKLFFLLVAVICGAVAGVLFHSVIFIVAFMVLREYAGGYHASTETRCEISTSLSIAGCVGVIKLLEATEVKPLLLIPGIIFIVVIFMLSPLDSPEKPLTKADKKHFSKLTGITLAVIFLLMLTGTVLKMTLLFSPCLTSLAFESVLLIAGRIKEKKINGIK